MIMVDPLRMRLAHVCRFLLSSCLALVVPAGALAAQGGAIEGTITSAGDALPLVSVRVALTGTQRATLTDARGTFRLTGLGAGDYTLEAARIGRQTRRVTVKVTDGATTHADLTLAASSVLLSDVVVSATRTAQQAREVAATVNVMPREQVETSPARTTDDLVREMPGLELPRASSTVSGPEQIVSIRGADEGRTLVLLDGVPLNDPWGEWVQWNRAPRFQLDHIEVVEGGGSSVWGNYAMGGVIQLFNRPIERRRYDLMASGGSRSAGDFSLYGSDVRGPVAYSVGADYGTGGGYTLLRPDQRGPIDQASHVTRRNVNARAEYALSGASNLYVTGNYFDDDRSLGTDLVGPNRRKISNGVVGGNFGSVGGGALEASVFGQVQRYESRSSSVNLARTAESPNVAQFIPSHDLGGSVQWSRPVAFFQAVSVGADFRYMHGRLDENVFASGTLRGVRTSGGTQEVGGAFISGVLAPIEPLRIEASARVDGWRSFDGSRRDNSVASPTAETFANKSNSAFAPRLGARYALMPSLAFRGSLFKAFRAPTLSEEYRTIFAGPNQLRGNPDLGPEYLSGYDAGIDWQPVSAVVLRATVFRNFYKELASFVFKQPGILQRQNVGTARSQGVEGEIAVRVMDELAVAGSYNYDDARVTSGSTAGTWVNRVPEQRGSARVTYSTPAAGTFNAIYRYEGPSHTLQGVRLAPFAVVDLDARRTVYRGVDLFVGVENLLDRQYPVNFSGTLESIGLPRTIRGGASVRSF